MTEKKTTDVALIKKFCRGSIEAYDELVNRYNVKVYNLAMRFCRNPEDAEEVMLDGFYKFFKQLPAFQYQGEAALIGWLQKIMVNECLMLLRKKNVFTIVTESAMGEISLEADAFDQLGAKEIFDLIVQLPVGYRTVFNLYEMEGNDHKEIATLLGIAEGTSKSQLSKAKSLLQKNIIKNESGYSKRKAR